MVRGIVLLVGVRPAATGQLTGDLLRGVLLAVDRRAIVRTVGIDRHQVTVRSGGTVHRTVTVRSAGSGPRTVTVLSVLVARVATIVVGQGREPDRPDVVIVVMHGSLARLLKTVIRSASSRFVRLRRSRTCPTTSSLVISTRSPAAS